MFESALFLTLVISIIRHVVNASVKIIQLTIQGRTSCTSRTDQTSGTTPWSVCVAKRIDDIDCRFWNKNV